MKKLTVITNITMLLHYLSLFAARPYIGLRLADMGADGVTTGFVLAAYSVVQVVCAPLCARTLERFGHRLPMAVAAAFFWSGCMGLCFARAPWQAAVCTAALGISHGQLMLASQYVMTGIEDSALRDRSIGIHAFYNSVGYLAGPLAGGFAFEHWGQPRGFAAAACVSALSLAAALLVPAGGARERGEQHQLLPLLADRQVLCNVLLSGVVFFAVDIVSTYLPLYASGAGLGAAAIGVVLGVNGAAQMAVRPLLGPLALRVGRQRLFLSCLMVGGFAMVCIGMLRSFWPLTVATAVSGLAIGLANPLTLVTVSDVADIKDRGRVLALRIMFNYAGQTASPIAFGALAGALGFGPVFWASGAVLLACAGFSQRIDAQKRRSGSIV